MSFNIAIDGPAGAGKSTVAKLIAKEKEFIYVDTGSLYRAIAVFMLNNKVDINNSKEVEDKLEDIFLELKYVEKEQRVFLNNLDVTDSLRTNEISYASSIVAAIPRVREKLVDIQRNIAKNNDVVMDGRDITSIVLPKANLKIYLDASVDERANRRFLELQEKKENISLEDIKSDIISRDQRDMNRDVSPLIKVEDAIYIDASLKSAEDVVKEIISLM